MSRKFGIVDWNNKINGLIAFSVSDAISNDELDKTSPKYRPDVARFEITQKYDEAHQRALAQKLCDYLNARQAAMEQAVEDNALLQKLML